MKKFCLLFIVILFGLTTLTGCGLITIPLNIAAAMSPEILGSTGTPEVNFRNEKMSDQDKVYLSQIKTLAIWPDNEGEVYMANKLESLGSFDSVVSPSRVKKTLRVLEIDHQIINLTNTEMLKALKQVCIETGTDAVAAWHKANIMIYSLKKEGIVYIAQTTIYKKKKLSDTEVLQLVGETAADKIIELVFGPADPINNKDNKKITRVQNNG
ncbi:MAG: hypothetical protein HQ573_07890 [Desulfobacteraceae bacterium]|nr:hypothetical protein [Desulfobacteraceae bacterium]